MRNVSMKMNGNTLTITVDMSQKGVMSASGKSLVIASTEGNVTAPDGETMIGLNVYRKNR